MSTGTCDVLFVFPPAPGNAGAFKNHLGVAYLRAALARDGMATAQYVNPNPGTIDSVATDILRRKSPAVGFTVYDSNARLSLALAESIKQQKPETQIVFGGPTATFSALPLMERHAVIDACVMGEAEGTAAQILSRLLGGGSLDDAQPGVAFRRDGEVVCTAMAPLVGASQPGVQCTLDCTPSPYLSRILVDGQEGLLTGRGCTHHCQYCCFAALGRMSLRLHSIQRVVAELGCIAEHQSRTGESHPVPIFDDAFTLVPSRAKALCKALADRKLKLALSCITRADTVDEELMELMQIAGFISINFGLESAVPSVLRAIGKVRPPDWHDPDLAPEREFLERVRESVHLARKYGLRVGVSIILGLPTETPADGAETLRFVRELPVSSYTHNSLWVYAGTPLWTTHKRYGIGCALDRVGLPYTTGYSYDVNTLKLGSRCGQEKEASLVRHLATDVFHGCDTCSSTREGTSTVVLESGELTPPVAEWLRCFLNVGGTVMQVYPAMKRREWWARTKEDRHVLNEHMVPASYYLQTLPKMRQKKNGDNKGWVITCMGVDACAMQRPELVTIQVSDDATSLVAWSRGRAAKARLCDISHYLRRPVELNSLMDRIEGEDTASPLKTMPAPPQIKYPGRWLLGKAPCGALRRIEISGCGEIRCCRQGEPIGRVGDTRETLSKHLAHQASEVEQRRGCAECHNIHCPRCPFPDLDDRAYCELMNTQERVRMLLHWLMIYSRLPLIAALEQAR